MAQVTGCANNQHQLLIALHTWGADNDGRFPPGSGYGPHNAANGLRGSGDFFDVLVPEFIEPPEVWYCPGGVMFHDTGMSGAPLGKVDTLWDFSSFKGRSATFSQSVYCNLQEKGSGYKDIPRKLSDPGDWVLVNDHTLFDVPTDLYAKANHPGIHLIKGLGNFVRGRNGPGSPRGINTGTVDGSVKWTPQGETMLGYPGNGGGPNWTFIRDLEPPRPGRPGMLP